MRGLVVIISLLVSFLPLAQAQDCPFDLSLISEDIVVGEDVICSRVTVPERHQRDNGKTITLSVATLPSPHPEEAPLVLAQGGPGGSTLDLFLWLLFEPELETFRQARDIVLIEQRGTLFSEPFLFCEEALSYQISALLNPNMSDYEYSTLQAEALLACLARFIRADIDAAAYNSLENAADMMMVMDKLGYTEPFNFYGVSYGAMLGQHLMRDYPERLRSVVLDAVVPLQENPWLESPRSGDRAIRAFFEAAQADFPSLEADFFALVEAWNDDPIALTITDPYTDETYPAQLNGDDLVNMLFTLLYDDQGIRELPARLAQIQTGNYEFLSEVYSYLTFDRTFSDGMYQSVICAEDADFEADDIPDDNLYPRFEEILSSEGLLYTCEIWRVPRLDNFTDEPVVSDLPVLLLSGGFDPITPPHFAESVAAHLPNSYHVTFPTLSHGVFSANACPQSIMLAFLADPSTPPETACVDELELDFASVEDLDSAAIPTLPN